MFVIKLFSFQSRDNSGSLFEVRLSPDRTDTRVGGKQMGFHSGAQRERKPTPKRKRLFLSVLDAVFADNEEEM